MLCFYRSLLILYFICILLLLLPTWRIKPDDYHTFKTVVLTKCPKCFRQPVARDALLV